MADHAVVRTDLMFGTNVNAGLRSFKGDLGLILLVDWILGDGDL